MTGVMQAPVAITLPPGGSAVHRRGGLRETSVKGRSRDSHEVCRWVSLPSPDFFASEESEPSGGSVISVAQTSLAPVAITLPPGGSAVHRRGGLRETSAKGWSRDSHEVCRWVSLPSPDFFAYEESDLSEGSVISVAQTSLAPVAITLPPGGSAVHRRGGLRETSVKGRSRDSHEVCRWVSLPSPDFFAREESEPSEGSVIAARRLRRLYSCNSQGHTA